MLRYEKERKAEIESIAKHNDWKINFRDNNISNEGLINFCTVLKDTPYDKFTKIDFCVNSDLSDRGLLTYSKFLAEHYMIRYLMLSGKLSSGGEIDFFRDLRNLSNLKVISFYGMELSSDSMAFVNVILENNKRIEKFILNNSNKKITHIGTEMLRNHKLTNCSSRKLDDRRWRRWNTCKCVV